MPIETDARVEDSDHLVHFFDTDESLVIVVGNYLSSALLDGDSAIIVAAPAHRELFLAALTTAGVDVAATLADGRLLVRDAADTLSQFAAGGPMDAEAFDEAVGGLVREACASGRPLRAYGEMVALL